MAENLQIENCYNWHDYRALIQYLKENTTLKTRVANVLRNHPYPTINGPTGRRTAFPSPGGMLWLLWVGTEREEEFAHSLETAGPDTVIVWAPTERSGEANLKIKQIRLAIGRCYRPEARFGVIEVWRWAGPGLGTTPPPENEATRSRVPEHQQLDNRASRRTRRSS